MTIISQIITDAYQYNNLVALTETPNAAEQAKGLRYLNRIFSSVFGHDLGTSLTSYTLGSADPILADYDIEPYPNRLEAPYALYHNSRVVAKLSGPVTVYLRPFPQDGERFAVQDLNNNFSTSPLTLNGNGRNVEGSSSVVLNINGTNSEWFFRADLGNWVKISSLSLTDEFPLPEEFEEYFITMLAMRLGASEDIDLNNQLQFVMREAVKRMRSRYRQTVPMPSEIGLLRLSGTGDYSFTGFTYG